MIMATPMGLAGVPPLEPGLEAVADDLLRGLEYSLVGAAAYPDVRLPFGSLEEAFQDAIGLRPAEQRSVYHSRAQRIAMLPAAVRQATFGRYARLGAEEFARGGLAAAVRNLTARRREPGAARPRLAGGARSADAPPGQHRGSVASLALYITDVSCLDRATAGPGSQEIAVCGLALDPDGGIARVGRFTVRDDFEHGVRKEYGGPGRKFCEFRVPETPGAEALVYGAAAFLDIADRAGFAEGLASAWAKASPILREAVETRLPGVRAGAASRTAAWVLDRFVRWLSEEFHDDVFPPGLAFAGLRAGHEPGQFTFEGRRGRYRVGGQWRVRSL
jgi:hypothetical protein